ncbi:LOW QUALITY PROTEIN: hypothetical protein V1477_001034 [Vespula maculifrons]|uniref:Uncharacterized protein n=1 Tax=Vespula maculifrons TaxID=7453 RepID=A0ABD2D0V8_VESMC
MCSGQWGYSPTRNDNKIGPLADFDSYWLSLVLNFDECPSQILLDVFGTSNNEELIYCLSLVLNFDECPSQILLDVFGTSNNEELTIIIFRNEVLLAQSCFEFRRVNIAVLIGCVWDNYCLSLVLNFDECPSQILLDVFGTSNNEELIIIIFRNEVWGYSPTRDNNKIGPLADFDSYWLSLVLNFDECPSQILLDVFGTSNNEELIYCLSLVLNFDECPSQVLLDVFGTSNNEELTGDTLSPVTTIKSVL